MPTYWPLFLWTANDLPLYEPPTTLILQLPTPAETVLIAVNDKGRASESANTVLIKRDLFVEVLVSGILTVLTVLAM